MKNFPTLIFQFGKVGSTLLTKALGGHYLIDPRDKYSDNFCIQAHSHNLVRDILEKTNVRIKMIVPIRFPIHRNISAFFEGIHKHFELPKGDILNLSHNVLEEKFRCGELDTSISWINQWVDSAIDILSDAFLLGGFDFQNPHRIITLNRLDILVIRMEDVEKWPEYLKMFFGAKIEMPKIHNMIGTQRWYGGLYKRFLNQYKISSEEASSIRQSKYVATYYSDEEIGKYIGDFS